MFISLFSLIMPIFGQIHPDDALQKLVDGNARYVQDAFTGTRRDQMRREDIVSKQEPFAIVLTCSDSRVPPEIIFDEGLGDIFVVRVAGNVAGPIELESIEFGAAYLHASVLLVLGHENCGAVKTVLGGQTKDIENIAAHIQPAITGISPDNLPKAIKSNVQYIVEQLSANPVLSNLVSQNKLKIVGGYYNLSTGEVTLLN